MQIQDYLNKIRTIAYNIDPQLRVDLIGENSDTQLIRVALGQETVFNFQPSEQLDTKQIKRRIQNGLNFADLKVGK